MDHKQPESVFPELQPSHFTQAELIDAEDEHDANHSDDTTISTTLPVDEFISPPTTVRSEELEAVSKRLERFEFVVATIARQPQETDADDQWKIQRQQHSAYRYVEMLETKHEAIFSTCNSPVSLFQQLSALPPERFNDLVSALEIASGTLPPPTNPHGTRVLALLDWVQSSSGPGMAGLQTALHALIANSPESDYADLGIEMVSIPGGGFTMGSPPDEPNRFDREGPQHTVTIQPFFMGRYPITQAQLRFLFALEPSGKRVDIARILRAPSFRGDNRPVEGVRWLQAVEFCDRLSRYTGREYRLPTEAEWEYACRAGTETPFHFGETISPKLANYSGQQTFDGGPEGVDRQETTPVDHFGGANAFGLSDMHGNVFEWCLDQLHESYEDAPADGSAWLSDDEKQRYVLRGGSWKCDPKFCRSASRHTNDVKDSNIGFQSEIGFRVACCTPFL